MVSDGQLELELGGHFGRYLQGVNLLFLVEGVGEFSPKEIAPIFYIYLLFS